VPTQTRSWSRENRERLAVVGVGCAVAAAALILYLGDPATSRLFPPCPFRWLTGFWCPGCGSARCLHALLHGDIPSALGFNPLAVLTLPFLGYAALSRALRAFRGSGLPRLFSAPFWGWLVVCVVFVYWVARNVPISPFFLLAP
jgi:hypothetical protein